MASRDVELLIRAKDEASKTFDGIVKSATEFLNSQKSMTKQAGDTGNALTRFGKAAGDINQIFRNIASANKIAKTLTDAESAAAALENEIGGLNGQLSKLDAEMKSVAATQAKLASESDRVEKSLKEQQAASEANQKSLAETNAAVREATVNRQKLATEERNLVSAIANSNAQLAKAQARFDELQQAVDAAEKPTARLVKSYAAAGDRVVEYIQKIDQQTAALAGTRASLETADQGLVDLTTQQALLSVATEQSKASVAGYTAELTKLGQQSRTVAKSQDDLAKKQEQIGAALKGREADFVQVNAVLDETRDIAHRSAGSMDEYAKTIRTTLKQALSAQQSTVSQINNAFQENRTQIRELATVMGQVGVPTKAMADAMRDLQQAGARLSTTFHEQQAVASQIGAAYRDTAGDANSMAAALRTASQQVAAGRSAFDQAAASATRVGTASQKIIGDARQAANAHARWAAEAKNSGQAVADANDKGAESYRRSANASRSALSYVQRLRGEVLSLASAYGGLQGALNVLQQTVTVQQTLEGATSRLNAVNKGDTQATAQDLDFIRRNANRLGIDMGVLANEFTKFAAATNNTAIAGKATRDIFISIAEAGRVSKLSLDDMSGIFKAVIQIASKGKFQLEELSGQLGDRLPGALQILADGMGITVDQLLKMTKDGEVMADNLINFAAELDKRYGGQLAKSLESTTTAMGQLGNAAFQALHVFGQAGFIEGFTKLVRDLTDVLKDPAFLDFASRISAVLGAFASAIGGLAKQFQLIAPLIGAFVGYKLAGFLTSAAGAAVTAGRAIGLLPPALAATAGAASTASGALGAAAPWIARTGTAAAATAGSVTLLGRAFQFLVSSTGVGLVLTGLTAALAMWATSATDATDALTEHRRIVDAVKDAYDKADGSVVKWRENIKKAADAITFTEARANLEEITRQVEESRKRVAAPVASRTATMFGGAFASDDFVKFAKQIRELTDRFESGDITAKQYIATLDTMSKLNTDASIKRIIEAQVSGARETEKFENAQTEAKQALDAFSDSTDTADKALKDLNKTKEDGSKVTEDATAKQQAFNEAMEALNKLLPETKKEMKEQAKIAEAWGNILTAIANLDFSNLSTLGGQLGQIFSGAQGVWKWQNDANFGDAAKELAGFTDGLKAAQALIAKRERYEPKAYYDVNAYRAGYGSDTYTTADNKIVQVTKDSVVSMADAVRDLSRRSAEFMQTAMKQVGADRFSSFNPQQQAVLTSIAYNYGSLPDRILSAVRTGSKEEIANAIRGLSGDNKGVNANRRNEEAYLFENAAFDEKNFERIAESQAKAAEKSKEFHDNLAASNQQMALENSLANEGIIKREQAKAIYEAEQRARKEGTELLPAEREQILANVAAKYKEAAAQEAVNAKKKEQEAIDQRVNDLQTRRNELQQQYKLQTEMGDTAGAAATKTELEGVNAELQKAIAAAIQFYQAMGGPGSDAAIAKLKTMQLETQKVGMNAKTALIDWTRVGELFASGLTNAFDQFAQAVAEGKSVGEAARDAFLKFASDFLIQIGKMIIQQAILNLLRGLGGPFASLGLGGGASVGLAHTGGIVGSKRAGAGNQSRTVSPAMFASAPRFHDGGFPGLRPNEVPLIAQKGEEMLAKNDPRNALNGGAQPAGGRGQTNVRIINTFDSGDVVSQGLATGPGEEAIFNFVKGNARTINDILQQG